MRPKKIVITDLSMKKENKNPFYMKDFEYPNQKNFENWYKIMKYMELKLIQEESDLKIEIKTQGEK